MTKKRTYGLLPDEPDDRDFPYLLKATIKLPASKDLRKKCPPIRNQGNIGSCSAQAGTSLKEFIEMKEGKPLTNLSRLFLYYVTRAIESNVKVDSGCTMRGMLRAFNKVGAPYEKLHPYIVKNFRNKPSDKAYADALNHRVCTYYRLYTLQDFKTCLAEGYPFLAGIEIYESFESPSVEKTGIVNIPKASEEYLGSHAILVVGFSDRSSRFICRNSWGVGFGLSGYFSIPYSYLTNPKLADSFWTVR